MNGQMMNYPLTTSVILEYGNRVFPAKEIISRLPDGSRHEYTYAHLYKRTKKLANALVNKLGIELGDRVATFAWNHYQHVELYYAIPGAGAVCHTLNIRLSVPQIAFIINHAEDKVVFVDATLLPLFEQIAPLVNTVEQYVLINAPQEIKTTLPNVIHYEDLIADQSEEFEWKCTNEDMAAGMCYTSGTTGDPKGAIYSHRSTYLHAMGIIAPNATGLNAKNRVLLIVPQFHVMAWGFPYCCLLTGAVMVLPSLHLKPEALIDIVSEEKVDIANGVPSIWNGVYHALKQSSKDVSSLKEIIIGGSALTETLLRGFEKDFGINACQAWGMTETSPLGVVSRLKTNQLGLSIEEQVKIRIKQGYEVPGFEMRVVKEDGTLAPRDGVTVGEFQVKGVWVISSYYKRENFDGAFTEDGWFRTGDVGTIDEDGFMQITDRTKDLIKSGGEWISSVALENAIMSHPSVKEAAVIAISDEKWTERPLAGIVLKEGENKISANELNKLLEEKFSSYQIPDKYVFIKEVPKTSVGKFNKKEMRRLYANGELF